MLVAKDTAQQQAEEAEAKVSCLELDELQPFLFLSSSCQFCLPYNNIYKKTTDSDWLRAMQFKCNTNL